MDFFFLLFQKQAGLEGQEVTILHHKRGASIIPWPSSKTSYNWHSLAQADDDQKSWRQILSDIETGWSWVLKQAGEVQKRPKLAGAV